MNTLGLNHERINEQISPASEQADQFITKFHSLVINLL